MTIKKNIRQRLIAYAEKYETAEFLQGDPSWFMHQVYDPRDQEIMAFLASCLSYGSRKAFFPKVQALLNYSRYKPFEWIFHQRYCKDIADNNRCFYRLYTHHDMFVFFNALQSMLINYGSIHAFLLAEKQDKSSINKMTALETVDILCHYFSVRGVKRIVPKNSQSSCKRICMFLRWMVRDHSPVDLGLWNNLIDKRSLIIPLDTHVMKEANALGLLSTRTTSMSTARKLTQQLAEIFPDDPAKGDFALFGYATDLSLK